MGDYINGNDPVANDLPISMTKAAFVEDLNDAKAHIKCPIEKNLLINYTVFLQWSKVVIEQ